MLLRRFLLPAGAAAVWQATKTDPKYIPICTLPILFGIQQLFEGGVWIAGDYSDVTLIGLFSLGYMFFSWLAWPIWVPLSVFFLEPQRRHPLYLALSIIGGVLGAIQ